MKTYILNILLCCFAEVFVGVLVPDGAIKKSVLSVVSLYFLFVIISPVLSFLKCGWFW